jgi:hypothetical protein
MYFWRIVFPRVFPMTVPGGGGGIFLEGGECANVGVLGKRLMRISVLGEYGECHKLDPTKIEILNLHPTISRYFL